MGTNNNIGQKNSLTVYGNPDSFYKLIENHGQLCKIKKALFCPCVAKNHGSIDFNCEICNGDGFIYTYQRRFLVTDENSKSCGNKLLPYWSPILSVKKAQVMAGAAQCGIRDLSVLSFTESEIIVDEELIEVQKKRVTYQFDGWTYVAEEQLEVDSVNKIMYANGTIYNAGYQSSNPLEAFSDIAQIVRVWNKRTGEELTNWKVEGKTITTTSLIEENNMYAEYYYADLTKVINSDINTKKLNESWTHELTSGETRMTLFPYWDVSGMDLIVLPATVLYKNETFTHLKDLDRLHEIEIFNLDDIILDDSGKTYAIDTDYILQGRHVKWTRSQPKKNAVCSVRYGYKPSFIIFEDNPQPNNLENKFYPKTVLVKSWSKTSKDDIKKLMGEKQCQR